MSSLKNSLRRRTRAAFTLLEMLIVIALIALLAGFTIANLDKLFGGSQEDVARVFVTSSMQAPLTAYKIQMGSYPSTAQGLQALLTAPDGASSRWKGPYLKTPGNAVPLDPWQKPYQYRFPGTRNPGSYDLFSFGPDGVESGDDIGNW
ncbi:type II secretion system major pseudopilin GspG [Opitutales bacterium ASA1]|uniref:type II secretion system major pseudopilin GspG n=1 Tax=Congregicoccus parvus TaxID=3081749 RepID=UPI002B2D59F9|nr:type II secretion system major pseudopilin GspG [Opitutales bacterium ASA1]